MHQILGTRVRIEQPRRRLALLRDAGLLDRVTLPRAVQTRVWFSALDGAWLT
ncbi:hypothetical protein ACWGLF_46975 [Streptomyces puniciscabiei]